ncbi:MAG TPA: hypothetical protein VJ777_26145, partial [Mycobacterium sp.]|nr:hypothetical protein [Mycobacterium sp.]
MLATEIRQPVPHAGYARPAAALDTIGIAPVDAQRLGRSGGERREGTETISGQRLVPPPGTKRHLR